MARLKVVVIRPKLNLSTWEYTSVHHWIDIIISFGRHWVWSLCGCHVDSMDVEFALWRTLIQASSHPFRPLCIKSHCIRCDFDQWLGFHFVAPQGNSPHPVSIAGHIALGLTGRGIQIHSKVAWCLFTQRAR